MAAFALFVLAVAGVAVFHHTVSGYPEGWLLAIAAGLGSVVALLLVASANSTKRRRARRKQLRRLRRGLQDQAAAPEPDHGGLLDAFLGPEQVVTPQPIRHPSERVDDPPKPLFEQARR